MVKYFPLDLIVVQGETYYTGKREFLIIKKIGTNAASDTHLKIDNKPLGNIIDLVAPLHVTSSNKLGPASLGNYYYVVPPETKFEVEGEAGAMMRLIGSIGKLEPGEAVPADVLSRFANQHNAYITHIIASYSLGTDVALAADQEVEVLSLTPKTIEKYVLAGVIEASVENYSPKEGELAVRFYIDNSPLDALTSEPGRIRGGIDILSMPRPPADATEEIPFSLAENPIELPGDHTLSIRVRNVSGGSISPASGTSLTFYIDALAIYIRTG